MHIAELEKAVRAVARADRGLPVLATLAGAQGFNVPLPAEFDTAAKSLMRRLQERTSEEGKSQDMPPEWI